MKGEQGEKINPHVPKNGKLSLSMYCKSDASIQHKVPVDDLI